MFTFNDRIVFIGDSITDSGRREEPEEIGYGYVRLIRDCLLTAYPDTYPEIINRGIGGDRVTDLAARWERDVLALNPSFISVSIGINDVWRQLDSPGIDQVFPQQFEEIYHKLLTEVKERTNAKIILMEPTIIEEDLHSEGNRKLVPYVEAVHKLAETFQAVLVPTHQAFVHYLKVNRQYGLTTDGVHMNTVGNMLMAQTWLKAVESADFS